jgi:hypothetical protein
VIPNTDPLLNKKMALSNFEIGQLTAFLYTLTDSTFLKDPRFAPPGFENNGKAPVDIHPVSCTFVTLVHGPWTIDHSLKPKTTTNKPVNQ